MVGGLSVGGLADIFGQMPLGGGIGTGPGVIQEDTHYSPAARNRGNGLFICPPTHTTHTHTETTTQRRTTATRSSRTDRVSSSRRLRICPRASPRGGSSAQKR